jgi:wyosine [tRNA(Phe)-imidazoG37] synthetase (radical SAM superfamily)
MAEELELHKIKFRLEVKNLPVTRIREALSLIRAGVKPDKYYAFENILDSIDKMIENKEPIDLCDLVALLKRELDLSDEILKEFLAKLAEGEPDDIDLVTGTFACAKNKLLSEVEIEEVGWA